MVWSPVSWISCSEHLARAPFPSSDDFYSISFPLANGAAWLAGEIYGIQLPKTILLSFCLPPLRSLGTACYFRYGGSARPPVDGSWAALRHSKLWYVCPSRGKMLLWRCLGPSPRLGFGFWRHETSHPDRCMHVRFASCPCASWLCTVI